MSAPGTAPAKKPTLIRWEKLRTGLITLAAASLLIVLFLDPVIKWVMIKTGQSVFGARVNIAAVQTKLLQGRVTIRGLQVADTSAPMQNLFQWDQADFNLRPGPLLEKKIIIDDAALSGLKFGAARKTSGALKREKTRPGYASKAAGRLWSGVEDVSLAKFDQAQKKYDLKTVLDPKQLATPRAADKAKADIQKTPDVIQKRLRQLNAEQRTAEFQKRVQTLGQGGSGPDAVLAKAAQAKTLQSDLMTFRKDVAAAQDAVTGQIQSAQSQVDGVKQAREADWNTVRSKLSLPSLDKASMARALFGPNVARWGERLLSGVHASRQYMPAKPHNPPAPPRGSARIIEFPRADRLPRFLLIQARLAGEVGREQPFGFTGTLTGLTSNPPLYGKPATITLTGSQGARSFHVLGVIDHTRDVPTDSLEAAYTGFSLTNMSFGQAGGMAFGLRQGEGRARVALKVKGDTLDGRADVQGSDLGVDPHVDLKSDSPVAQRAAQSVTTSLSAIKTMDVGVGIAGTLESPDLSIDSDIGAVVADVFKNALGSEVGEQEKALRAEFDRQTAGTIQDLQGQVDALKQTFLPQLASNNKIVDDLFAQLQKQATESIPGVSGKPLNSFKNLFGH